MKNRYIELMDRTLTAYSYEHIVRYFDDVKKNGLTEHGFPRLTANIGILIANGRRDNLLPIFTEMMDFCCEQIPRVKAANDFSVKEIVFCIMALEKRGLMPEKTEYWRSCLKTVEPIKCYNVYANKPTDVRHNWACFTAVSEFMRQYIGLCDSAEFIDIQIPTQLVNFEENGMYRDPNNPMVYDLVPRGLFAVMMSFGYNGKYAPEIDALLKKSGLLTLYMQSVTGEIPYGGRSSGFPHNEAHFAVVMEYEAKRYAKEGDFKLAGAIKAAISLALDSIELWLSAEPIRHIKNRFPTETKYGCEDYAYFDKYMITTASFLYAAYLVCDDGIETGVLDEAPRAFNLSEHFHKTFLKAGGYFAEIDTKADPHYDCSGLGRVHKKGAPSTVCLSTPCAAHPLYKLDIEAPGDVSLAAGYVKDGITVFATGENAVYEVLSIGSDNESASALIKTAFADGTEQTATYRVSAEGVEISVTGAMENALMLPAFVFDGEKYTDISLDGSALTVSYGGYVCKYETNGAITDLKLLGGNRNGHCKAYAVKKKGELKVRIVITEVR